MWEPVAFDVTVTPEGDTVRIACSGELDMSTRDAFEATIAQGLQRSCTRLELDLSGLTFFGSEGVHALLNTAETCARRGVHLSLQINDTTARVMKITGVYDRFVIRPPGEPVRLDDDSRETPEEVV